MAMARIGIERDIGDKAEIWRLVLDRAASAADKIFWIERLAGLLIPQARRGKGKQRQRRNAKFGRLGGRARGKINGQPLDAWHGRHGLARVFALAKKNRPDEIVHSQA